MNKVILTGRLTRDPETRYSQSSEPIAITRFSVAVARRFNREGEAEADFINCVAFGKTAEFINKYFNKGKSIAIVGRIQTGSYENKDGKKVYTTDILVEEVEFCGDKYSENSKQDDTSSDDYYNVDSIQDDDDLPF